MLSCRVAHRNTASLHMSTPSVRPPTRRTTAGNAARKSVPDFSRQFREARLAARLTQEQAAELLGVTRRAVQTWEEGVLPIYPAQRGALGILRAERDIVTAGK
jgi:DNA-binding transcriptional regulator YiaG